MKVDVPRELALDARAGMQKALAGKIQEEQARVKDLQERAVIARERMAIALESIAESLSFIALQARSDTDQAHPSESPDQTYQPDRPEPA